MSLTNNVQLPLSPQKKITPSPISSVGDFYFGPPQTLFERRPEIKISSKRSEEGRNFLLQGTPPMGSRSHPSLHKTLNKGRLKLFLKGGPK
jgi:hypothetical protein